MGELVKIITDDMRAALMLLTRLPVWSDKDGAEPNLSRSTWVYPLVGMIVGGLGAGTILVTDMLDMPSMLSVAVAVAVMTLATGAFHEDGLADTADGIGGGWTKERKLEIMRDSRIGTYGTMALIISFSLRIAALIAIGDAVLTALVLMAAATVSRSGIVVLLTIMPPARPDGMGTVAQNPPVTSLICALLVGIFVMQIVPFGMIAGIFAGLGILSVYWVGMKHLDGYTGDLLGTGQQVSEIFFLISLSTLIH